MPRRDLRAGTRGKSGYTTVTYHTSRGRTRNATLHTRTNGTTGVLKIRGAGPVRTEAGVAKASTAKPAAGTWSHRY